MSEILNLRRAIKAELEMHTAETPTPGRLAGVKVYEHGGDFDNEKELERYHKQAMKGAIFIAVLGVDARDQGGLAVATVTVGAFVLTVSKQTRDEMAISIVDALMNYVTRWPGKHWAVSAKRPQDISAHNLYNEKLDARSAALWVVSWHQDVDLKTTPEPVLADFTEMHIDYEVQNE